jgi:Lon protease-like protein
MAVTPQFPLGTVLFPSMVLPLHVFEPRYRAMVTDVLAGDGVFGVVLIERGHEVGGGDQRSTCGTLAKVVRADALADGRWALVAVGVDRFRVNQWLPDAPYPRADIEPWPDEAATEDLSSLYGQVQAKFRRCLALASEAGFDIGPWPDAIDDVNLGCMQMAALAPVGPHDKQALLGAPGPSRRLALLDQMIDETVDLIEARLAET